jgi:hypothetical protein
LPTIRISVTVKPAGHSGVPAMALYPAETFQMRIPRKRGYAAIEPFELINAS